MLFQFKYFCKLFLKIKVLFILIKSFIKIFIEINSQKIIYLFKRFIY